MGRISIASTEIGGIAECIHFLLNSEYNINGHRRGVNEVLLEIVQSIPDRLTRPQRIRIAAAVNQAANILHSNFAELLAVDVPVDIRGDDRGRSLTPKVVAVVPCFKTEGPLNELEPGMGRFRLDKLHRGKHREITSD